jgi:hypothetical protein
MMKILKSGRWREGYTAEVECTGHGWGDDGCGAVLLLEVCDLFGTPLLDQDGRESWERLALFICPQCGNRTEITDVPVGVILHSLPR